MTREIETWLSDSRVGNYSVVDHRSRRPVLSPLAVVTVVERHNGPDQLCDYDDDHDNEVK